MRELAWLVFVCAVASAQPADTIYYNGKIVTLWEGRPAATALAVRAGRFLKVGANDEVLATAGPATVKVDLKGRSVVPGLIDSHTHPTGAALSEKDGPVPVMKTIPEVQQYIRQQAARLPAGQLIFVPKIYSTRMVERRYPTRYELDAASGDRPAMTDNSYSSVLNSALLKKLGITRDTPDPADGKIIKDERGEPTGLMVGASKMLSPLRRSRTKTTYQDVLWALRTIQKRYNQAGLTSTIERSQGPEGFRAYQELERRGELTVRTYVTYTISVQGTSQQVREDMARIPFTTGWGNEWVRVGNIKCIIDGGILLGTAYLREAYGLNTQIYGYKDPDYRGVLSVKKENLVEMARAANDLGWQMTAHAAGGGAVDLLLDAYEAADRDKSIRDRRFTISHGNFPDEQAIARARKLGVVFDCQPAWHHFDGPALKDVFGPRRIAHFSPLHSLFDAGVVVAGGSDHMVRMDARNAINPYHPFFGMWMTVTRQTADGAVLGPEQRITRMEALRMWTLNAAYLSFEEKIKGSIEPGKLADFVVITKDYLTCPVEEIRGIEALRTVVGGKVVHDALPR